MTYAEYRAMWKEHTFYDMWLPVPSVAERCECGHKITRRITSTITCGKCGHVVKSYERIRRGR